MRINEELKKLIGSNALALATVNEDGTPHCIAVAFVKVLSSNQILITDNYMVKTKKNIRRNPHVALTVWNRDWKKACVGYELEGIAQYFTEGKWVEEVRKMPENEKEPCKGAILIVVKSIKKLA